MILVSIGITALVTAFVICLFGIFGVIKKSPDDPPYSYLLNYLIFGGAGFCILGVVSIVAKR